MNKNRSPAKDIFFMFLCCVLIVSLIRIIARKGQSSRDFTFTFCFDSTFHSPVLFNINKTGHPKQQKTIERRFNWVDPQKNDRETVFFIPEAALKKEIRKFGTGPGTSSSYFIEKRGFKVIGRRNYVYHRRIRERLITIVDYKEIFQRNLEHFKELTEVLSASAGLSPGEDPLHTFLTFIQHIKYQLPPSRYKGKFINSFFVPLVCLYEQYGDCDSKSLLLGEFLCTIPGSKEKAAVVLVRGRGLSHALLAVKRNPLPGMTSLFDYKKGYYIVLETTNPGWFPGFISRRVADALKAGFFHFVELNP